MKKPLFFIIFILFFSSKGLSQTNKYIYVDPGSTYIYNPYPDTIDILVIVRGDVSYLLKIPAHDFRAAPNEKLTVIILCGNNNYNIGEILPDHLFEIDYDKTAKCYSLANTKVLKYR
ncbi:MAG: hypothetical protein JWQ38_3627 [Flavipsychrobacter sp.]|nr:hypothetical protein [Flavipsychrobacter sp.]